MLIVGAHIIHHLHLHLILKFNIACTLIRFILPLHLPITTIIIHMKNKITIHILILILIHTPDQSHLVILVEIIIRKETKNLLSKTSQRQDFSINYRQN